MKHGIAGSHRERSQVPARASVRAVTAAAPRRARAAALLAAMLVLVAVGSLARAQSALSSAMGATVVAVPQQLLGAMKTRVGVSFDKRSGRTIPASHCRHAPGGCDQRLAAFADYLVASSTRFGLDPWLMAAMAFKESGMNPFALGSLGEMGILQINPERRDAKEVRFIRDEWYRKRCRKQPGACQEEVVNHAAQVLARSLEHCSGDLMEALGAYNTGRCGGNDRYAKRVLSERDELLRAAGLKAPAAVSASSGRASRRRG